MYLSTLRAVGGSIMFAIPKPILDGLGLVANAQVGLSVADGRLIVEPQLRPRYSLSELLAQCDPSALLSDEDKDWLDSDPVVREAH